MDDCGHASNGRYTQGCRCDACRAAHVMAWKKRELRKLENKPYFVDAGPVRQRLEALYWMGYTRHELARYGISRSTQYSLTHKHDRTGEPIKRIKRETAERISEVANRRLGTQQLVAADAAKLMVSTWVSRGLEVGKIAEVTGLSEQTVDKLSKGKGEKVYASTLETLLDKRRALERAANMDEDEPRKRGVKGEPCTFVLYRGDEVVDIGTAQEIAEHRGVNLRTVYTYATDQYAKRGKGSGRRLRLVRVDG